MEGRLGSEGVSCDGIAPGSSRGDDGPMERSDYRTTLDTDVALVIL